MCCGAIRYNYEPGQYVAIVNSGGIRAGIPKGPVTRDTVKSIVPFGSELRLVAVTGATIRAMLEHSVTPNEPQGSFLIVSGLRFWWNPANKPLSRITRLEVHRFRLRVRPCAISRTWNIDVSGCLQVETSSLCDRGDTCTRQVKRYPAKDMWSPLEDDEECSPFYWPHLRRDFATSAPDASTSAPGLALPQVQGGDPRFLAGRRRRLWNDSDRRAVAHESIIAVLRSPLRESRWDLAFAFASSARRSIRNGRSRRPLLRLNLAGSLPHLWDSDCARLV